MGSLGSVGSPDQAYGRARGQAGDPQLQSAPAQQVQQQSSDLPVSLSSSACRHRVWRTSRGRLPQVF